MALDFLKNLFGGSSQQSTPIDFTPDEFRALRTPFMQTVMNALGNQRVGPAYTGPLVAPIQGAETDVLSQLGSMTGPGNARQSYLESVIGGGFLPGEGGSNRFLEAAIKAAQRPVLEGLTETLTRDLPGRFTQAGQFVQPKGSSAFDFAAATASKGAANALADIATNMSFAGYEAERGRQQQAVQLGQQEVDTTIKNLQAQALPRMIEDLGIERGLALFKQQTDGILQILGLLAGVTQPTIASQSSGESNRGIIPGLTGLFGGGKSVPVGGGSSGGGAGA